MRNKLILVKGEKWMGLYLNGKLLNEYHEISEKEILKHGKTYDVVHAHREWLNDRGYFPENYHNVFLAGDFWK